MTRALLLFAFAAGLGVLFLEACGPDCNPNCVCAGEVLHGCEDACSEACADERKKNPEADTSDAGTDGHAP